MAKYGAPEFLQLAFFILLLHMTTGSKDMVRLHQTLLADYIQTPPVRQWDTSLSVVLAFDIYQLQALNGQLQVMETFGRLTMHWDDDYLSWDPANYSGIDRISMAADRIWTPLIGLTNSATFAFNQDDSHVFRAMVTSAGNVTWAVTTRFESTCRLNMYTFPFDHQHCALEFGNLDQTPRGVTVCSNDNMFSTNDLLENKEFNVLDTSVKVVYHNKHTRNGYDHPCIQFWITMQRKAHYHVINVVLPAMMLAVLSSFTFFVPSSSGEKLSLGITVLLSFSVFLLLLSENMPHSSDPVPVLVVYLTLTVCISTLSILVQMVVLNMYHIEPAPPLPSWLKKLTKSLSMVCSPYRVAPSLTSDRNELLSSIMVTDKLAESVNAHALPPCTDNLSLINALILVELRTMSSHIKKEKQEAILQEQWRYSARVLDRLFLFLFGLYQVCSILFIFITLGYG